MLRGWRKFVLIAVLIGLATLGKVLQPYVSDLYYDDEVLVTISPETTVIDSPVRPDGYIDYLAAINARESDGVTPENNAAVVLWEVWGTEQLSQDYLAKYFEALGVPPLPAQGDYLPEWYTEVTRSPERLAVMALPDAGAERDAGSPADTEQPTESGDPSPVPKFADGVEQWAEDYAWTDEQIPYGRAWMIEHEAQFQALIAAAQRPQYYSPLVQDDPDDSIMAVLVPEVQLVKKTSRVLCFYAMGCLGQGKTSEAAEALLAALRWGRHASQGSTLVSWVAGVSAEAKATSGLETLLCSGQLSAQEIQDLKQQIDALPPASALVNVLREQEQLFQLGVACHAARCGPAVALGTGGHRSWYEQANDRRARRWMEWDPLLVRFNTLFERELAVIAATDETELLQAEAARDEMRAALDQDCAPISLGERLWSGLGADDARQRLLQARFIMILLPHFDGVAKVEASRRTGERLLATTLALGLYKAEHGHYPADLAALVPNYLPELPVNAFSQRAPLVYALEEQEFVLYSLGPDGEPPDEKERPDLIVRSKPEPPPAKPADESFFPVE